MIRILPYWYMNMNQLNYSNLLSYGPYGDSGVVFSMNQKFYASGRFRSFVWFIDDAWWEYHENIQCYSMDFFRWISFWFSVINSDCCSRTPPSTQKLIRNQLVSAHGPVSMWVPMDPPATWTQIIIKHETIRNHRFVQIIRALQMPSIKTSDDSRFRFMVLRNWFSRLCNWYSPVGKSKGKVINLFLIFCN